MITSFITGMILSNKCISPLGLFRNAKNSNVYSNKVLPNFLNIMSRAKKHDIWSVAQFLCAIIICLFINGCSTSELLRLPASVQMVDNIDVKQLKQDLKDSRWNSADSDLFGNIYARLPDITAYRDSLGSWSIGFANRGKGDRNENKSGPDNEDVQHFFGEKNVWVILFSDDSISGLRKKEIKKTDTTDTVVGYKISRHSLAYEMQGGEQAFSGLLGLVSSLIGKATLPAGPNGKALADTAITVSHFRKLVSKGRDG